MDTFSAIDALLATAIPLPPPHRRAHVRSDLRLTPGQVARVLETDPATLIAWESGTTEPEGQARTTYAYFLIRAQTVAELVAATAPTHPLGAASPVGQSKAAAGQRIPAPRRGALRPSTTVQGPIAETVKAALAAHGDGPKATEALVAGAASDAMRLFETCREGGRCDIVRDPPLPDMLRTSPPGAPDLIWEARVDWQHPHLTQTPGTVATLNISGARLSALKTHLPIGQLKPTAPHHDPKRSGIYRITPATWEHDTYLPNPLGTRHEPGPVWITEPTLRLLLRLMRLDLCAPPTIHEAYTSGSTENLLERFRTTLRDARTQALEEDDHVTLAYVTAMHTKFVAAMGELAHNTTLRRPDWTHIIHSQAYATLWMKAYKAYKAGLTLARVRDTGELHLQGDWRHVFEEGTDLGKVTLNSTYQPHATSAASEQGKHMLCIDPCVEKRRYEYAGGRYVGCRTCGGDLCTGCRTVHLAPSDVPYELNDDNLCPGCQQAK
ncbi:transcriptional regulator [Streptomyces sp. NBC_01304]|uniref:transcriptional regulator n=1 Tax=Streptomyces sp. NBC_01304 TaxID=2903818 RepID=UPI002E0E4EFC|nr:transcriptional regulator [Streptomyces sp. NBC_01304]WSJ90863.1 transcriptional regulator [Streptomyces sp. NBC_01304]